MKTRPFVFNDQQIRRTFHNNEWWFVVEDVVQALIDSKNPKQYIQPLKRRDLELAKGRVQIVHTLSIATTDGLQRMLCANTASD
jgi:DNA-damage-inducible protein D